MDKRLSEMERTEAARLAADAAEPATDGEWLLRRYRHQRQHLDEIERALGHVAGNS